jgi:hypothetical protein
VVKNLGFKEVNYNLEQMGRSRVNSMRELQRSLGVGYIRRRPAMDGKYDSIKKINTVLGS